ncbi:protein pinocchio isoform X2 [Zophobas morio]|uniref:protein pinocchio isoform X2 n=1 Tax=Zophobas morio TaxID=2755281 RepID=UPI0030836C7A
MFTLHHKLTHVYFSTMLRVESNTQLAGFTEFEEDILFDQDDPDFDGVTSLSAVPVMLKVHGNMSLASVHPAELHSSHSSLTTLSHSLDDITEAAWSPQVHSDHVLTIEELRLQMTSCFTCGVSWSDSHVSLDCSECGGYALERPCPECEGACGAKWKRDLSMSHASSKARWEGKCAKKPQQPPKSSLSSQELSLKLEKLSANS